MKRTATQYLNVPKWSEMQGLRNSNQEINYSVKCYFILIVGTKAQTWAIMAGV
jgi:hypothetical protein